MDGYKISEAARATGFSVSALRFYEQAGVVVPERTATGYRSYDEDDLESLRFVARGKQLGLRLDEITELLSLLEKDECSPVQNRIHALVTKRIAQAQDRIAELVGFTAQLQETAARLGVHTPDGACDDDCGCTSEPSSAKAADDNKLIPLTGSEGDIGCSLDPNLVGRRMGEWNEALNAAVSREWIPGGVRIRFGRDVDVVALTRLAAAEQSCCSFFAFRITIGQGLVDLDVSGPDDSQAVIASVFGVAA